MSFSVRSYFSYSKEKNYSLIHQQQGTETHNDEKSCRNIDTSTPRDHNEYNPLVYQKLDESTIPLQITNEHYLFRIFKRGYYKSESNKKLSNTAKPKPRIRLDVAVSVSDLTDINMINQSYSFKLRLYMMWMLDDEGERILSEFLVKANESSEGYHSLSESEIKTLHDLYNVPKIGIFNATTNTEWIDESVRLYGGQSKKSAVMWHATSVGTCRQMYDLKLFPLDAQTLNLDIQLNSSATWSLYDLTVNTVQFHANVLKLQEWRLCQPEIARASGGMAPQNTTIKLKLKRVIWFYGVNVVLMMSILSFLGLITFYTDIYDVSSRQANMLTILLTAFALKLMINDHLPKVAYTTIMDKYILISFSSLAITCVFTVIPSYFTGKDKAAETNLRLFVISLMSQITLLLWFFYEILKSDVEMKIPFIRQRNYKTKVINVIPGKDWYGFDFSIPPHIDTSVM